MNQSIERILETCVYCLRHDVSDPEVLLVPRKDKPELEQWVPLGGKVGLTESPFECALQTLTSFGLRASSIQLRGLVTEVSPYEFKQWLLFLYVATGLDIMTEAEMQAGNLKWWPIRDLSAIATPQSDAVFGPAVLSPSTQFYEATILFDDTLTICETRVARQQ